MAFFGSSTFYTINASINDVLDKSLPVIQILSCDYSATNIRCSTALPALPSYYDGDLLYIVGGVVAIDQNTLAMAVVLNERYPQTQTLCLYTFPIEPTNGTLDCQDGTAALSPGLLALDTKGNVVAPDVSLRTVNLWKVPPFTPSAPTAATGGVVPASSPSAASAAVTGKASNSASHRAPVTAQE